jgi:hypothetical protein
VVLQVMNNARPELADIGLDLADILPETVQFSDHDFITVRSSVLPAGYQRPGYDDDQDSDGSDYLSQPS